MSGTAHTVCSTDALQPGDKFVTQIEGKEIAVFNIEGEYRAYLNWCPHQGGPVCEGNLTGTQKSTFDRETLDLDLEWTQEGEILNCPWHGWEFEVRTGESLSRKGVKLPSYAVEVEDGEIIVSV